MENKGQAILKAYERLVNERMPLDTIWADCFKHSYPMRGQGFLNKNIDGVVQAVAAKKDQAILFDSTATDSVRLLASSVLSALTPPNQQWFSLAINNVADDYISYQSKAWLENSAEHLFKLIHSSNYDAQALEFFTDEMVGGMVGLYVEKREGKFYFEVWPLASLYCQETLGDGYIDTIYRLVRFTPAEAFKKFGNNIPEAVANEYKKDPYSSKQFDFVHTIRPRLDKKGKQVKGKISRSLPYESVYVCKKSNMVCLESGYHEMPVIVPRWMRIPDTDYAFGPMNDALPDMKTLNKVVEFMLQNAEMAISGTFVAKDDGVFNVNTARIGPRRVWMVADTNNIKPLAAGGDINFAVQEIGRLQGQIRRTLLADQLGPSEKVNMTAAEVNTRTNLIRQILGPIFGRLQAEYLEPLINRCFGLAIRDGDFGAPPEDLQGNEFHISYRSPLALAQKQQQLEAIDQFEQRLVGKLQIDPSLLDLYDIEAATRKSAELLGVDIELMRDTPALKLLRKNKQDQAAQQQAQAMGQAAQQGGVSPEQMQQALGGLAA